MFLHNPLSLGQKHYAMLDFCLFLNPGTYKQGLPTKAALAFF
jgi:hypothetical protein